MKTPNPGTFREQVAIQENTGGQNARGDQLEDWVTVGTVRAGVEATGGRESPQANRVEDATTFQVTHWYYDGLTPKHRYLWGTTAINIGSLVWDAQLRFHQAQGTARGV